MSTQLISLSPDLTKLKEDGYEVEIKADYLVIRNIPYVNSRKQVRHGAFVSDLSLAGGKTAPPQRHIMMFAGDHPCDKDGNKLDKIICETHLGKKLAEGLVVDYSFSRKLMEGASMRDYKDYYEKVTTYDAILSSHAQAIDPHASARTRRVVESTDPDSVFVYNDSASSRAGITVVREKLKRGKVGIVGTGGSGSYTLDLVAKTPVPEIHIFDGDTYYQHNAFRSPGAADIEDLRKEQKKVHYLSIIYSRMHKRIIPHDVYIDASNVELLRDMSFVFLCMDAGAGKKIIVDKLEEWGIDFVDVGMGLELIDESVVGMVRVTTSTSDKRDHVHEKKRISFVGDGHENLYATNIQIAELNALSAALAVVKWKKLWGFYKDMEKEHSSAYVVSGNALVNDDKT